MSSKDAITTFMEQLDGFVSDRIFARKLVWLGLPCAALASVICAGVTAVFFMVTAQQTSIETAPGVATGVWMQSFAAFWVIASIIALEILLFVFFSRRDWDGVAKSVKIDRLSIDVSRLVLGTLFLGAIVVIGMIGVFLFLMFSLVTVGAILRS